MSTNTTTLYATARGHAAVGERLLDCARRSRPLRRALEHHFAARGKEVRAQLALLASESLDLPEVVSVPWAAACELLHNASLLHDDLIDLDRHRRGIETVWSKFGADQAILSGDHLLNEAFGLVATLPLPPEAHVSAMIAAHAAVSRTIRGASEEGVRLERPNFSVAHYERMVAEKTGSLLALPVEGALLMAGRSEKESSAARQALTAYGSAYQIEDDLADVLGQKEGREPGSGLRRGLVDAPVAHYWRQASPAERVELSDYFARRERDAEDVEAWRRRIAASRAIDLCRQHVHTLCVRARTSLAILPEPIRAGIRDLLGNSLLGRVTQ